MTTLTESLTAIFSRELTTLRMEIEAYPTDAALWRMLPGIANSGGTLALHLTGNLQHFIGAVLGKSGFVRNRDAEFALRNLSRAELVRQTEAAKAVVSRTLQALEPARLQEPYPEPVAKVHLDTGDFLVHLSAHLSYHLGQLDYHRRIVTGGVPLGGALSPTRLASASG
jgi:DinB family protein